MRTKTAVLLIAAAALACRGRSGPAQRAQQQYDVVQEGQTTSASTTVGAPGEVQPPVTTATNTDTTGSFTLGTAPAPANMPGGPATGVLPPQQPGTMASSMPPMGSAPAAPAAAPRAVTIVRTPSQTPVLTNTQPPPRTTERRPPPPPPADVTTTSNDTAATSTTDTTATTDTTSTDDKPKKNKKDSGDKTDTSAPPPTQTDTIGNH